MGRGTPILVPPKLLRYYAELRLPQLEIRKRLKADYGIIIGRRALQYKLAKAGADGDQLSTRYSHTNHDVLAHLRASVAHSRSRSRC